MKPASSSVRWLVGKNTTAQLVGKAVGAGITFFITIIIARRFGAAGYGDFTKITTFVAFFYLVADFGLNAVFLRESEKASPSENHHLWHALISLRILLSLALVFASILFLGVLPGGDSQGYTSFVKIGILLFSPTIIFQAILTSGNAIFQKHLRYDLSMVATSVGSIISLILILVATQSQQTIIPIITSLLVGSIITAILALFFASRLHNSWGFSFDTKRMKKLFIASLPLAATLMFNLVYFHADSIILTVARSTKEVGVYGLAYKFFEFPLILPTFFMNSLYPLLLRAMSRSQKEFVHLLKKAGIYLFVGSLGMVIIFWIAGPLLTLVKPEFSQSVPVFRTLIVSLPFFFLSSLTMWTLIALKKQVVLALIYCFAMVGNILFNAWLIPIFGIMAAAWITVASEGFVLGLSALVLLKNKFD